MKTIKIDWKKHCKWYVTLKDDTTFKFVPPYVQKKKRKWYNVFLFIQQDIVGNRKIILPDNVKWIGNIVPTFSLSPNTVDVITMYYCNKMYYAMVTLNIAAMPKAYRYNKISPYPEVIF